MANKFKIRSKKHRDWVASHGCCISHGGLQCNQGPVDADHLMRAGGHGMGLKESDELVVPLCRYIHHTEKTRTGDERQFWAKYGYTWKEIITLAKYYKENSPCKKINP